MKNKLLIVTDLGLLKAYKLHATPRGTPRLELLEEVRFEEAHRRLVDRVTDFAGRHSSPTQKSWAPPMSDDHNLKLETKRRLVKQIAGHVKRLIETNGEDGCWLATHREINDLILAQVPKPFRDRIETMVTRDLVKSTKQELLSVFAPYFLAKESPPIRVRRRRPS